MSRTVSNRNILPHTLEELAEEYKVKKKELDERARQWIEKRREMGEPPESDEQEREREKMERKAKRRLELGSNDEQESRTESSEAAPEFKIMRPTRSGSVLIKRADEDADTDETENHAKKRSDSQCVLH